MNYKENFLRVVENNYPKFIPMSFHINDACFHHYDNEYLFELMEEHKLLFPDFKRPKKGEAYIKDYSVVAKKDIPYEDDFGCVWETSDDGITGTVTKHPLDNLDKLSKYEIPDPNESMGLGPIDWHETEKYMKERKEKGLITIGGLRHGHTFLQLCDLMGYENLLYAMNDEDNRLYTLIDRLLDFNLYQINKYISMGVDVITIPEDLGMQNGPMLSPDMFKKYIKPSYVKLVETVKESNVLVHMHSDGDIRLLVDDIIECGIDIINLQDLVNGIDWIANKFNNKICVDLDLDRQAITPFGTKDEIENLIKTEVKTIGNKKGGLMMIYGLYPGVKKENIKHIMDLMEKYAFYYQ